MRRDDLYHVGEQIQTILQDAIDSQNFKELNSKVYDVVGGAMDTVKESMSQAVDMGRQTTQEVYRRSYAGTAARPAKRPAREIYVKHPAGEISGPALFITGLIMSMDIRDDHLVVYRPESRGCDSDHPVGSDVHRLPVHDRGRAEAAQAGKAF